MVKLYYPAPYTGLEIHPAFHYRHPVEKGGGLFRDVAYRVLDPEDLLARLREAQAARPDLWHAWSALIQQLADMQRLDEALSLLRSRRKSGDIIF